MKILTAQQIREADQLTTEKTGISSLQLMENAATAVVNNSCLDIVVAEQHRAQPRLFLALCGKGNNGGDGLAIARLLNQSGRDVRVVLAADPSALSPDAAVQWQRWQACNATTHIVRSEANWLACRDVLGSATHVLDALLGAGLRGPVEGVVRTIIEDVNRRWRPQPSTPRIVAVDIPSGLPADGSLGEGVAMRAHHTITFTAPKLGLLLPEHREYVGHLQVAPIGTPEELLPESTLHWIEPFEFRGLPLERRSDAHKGDFGHVLVVGGSRGKAGAAALAGMGALYAGAGLVTVAAPESSLAIVAGHAPELMTEPLPETDAGSISLRALDYARLEKLQEGKSVLAIGPGLGTHPETQELIRTLVSTSRLPVILDADGLNAFAGRANELANRQTALLAVTPHPGEMARLLACSTKAVQAQRTEAARDAAAKWKCAVILKGAGTIVAPGGGSAYLNTTGNPWMASGGSGDVLTGALAGYVAQFGSALWPQALCFGVHCHGLAADIALQQECGPVLASAIARHLPHARHAVVAALRPTPHA